MSRRNLILIGACVAGLFILAGLAWRAGVFAEPPSTGPGGPFQMVDQDGKPASEKILDGKWSVVFFGFT